MNEIVYIAASLRLPILMPVVNRALSGNINIHNDHSDTMSVRDSGWIQLYAENSQEAYDLSILGLKLAEHKDVQLPVIVALDGFIISHSIEVYESLEDEVVKKFVGEKRETQYALLDVDNPVTVGPLDLFDYYFEHKRSQIEAHDKAYEIFPEIAKGYEKISGRKYDYYEGYYLEDAEYVIVALGSGAGTIKHVVNSLRKEGKKVGLLKITMFRPFPYKEIANALKNVKSIAVLDKSASFGANGPVFNEIKSALYDFDVKIPVFPYLYGLGGRDFKAEDAEEVFADLIEGKASKELKYIGLRG
jgi:pyruvate ferredoxin oxidoreductase alpha subunit